MKTRTKRLAAAAIVFLALALAGGLYLRLDKTEIFYQVRINGRTTSRTSANP